MTTLSPQQITQLAYNAGFRGDALKTAVAVALAESSGNPNAYNPELAAGTKTGSGSRGLWQIYGTAHPQYNNDAVLDPQANANAAYAVWREAGGRFTPWSTFNNGAYLTFLRTLGNIAQGVSTAAQNSVQSVTQTASAATSKLYESIMPPGLIAASETIGAVNEVVTSPGFVKYAAINVAAIVAGSTFIVLGIVLFFWVGAKSIGSPSLSAKVDL